jgi:hypothetical protein
MMRRLSVFGLVYFLTGDFVAQGPPLDSAGGYNGVFSLASKICAACAKRVSIVSVRETG